MSTATFHILLALADEERHGYAIMREIEFRSGGKVKVGPGTLYTAMQRLVESGWIEELDGDPDVSGDERRRYYRLTSDGRKALEAEASRLRSMVEMAQAKKVIAARR